MDTWSIGKNEPKTNPNEPKTNPIKANKMPKQTQFKPKQTQFQSQYMLPRLTINPRRKSSGYYPGCRFFAANHGPNLSCFAVLLFDLGIIFSEKKQQIQEITYKAGAGLCRLVYIRKSLHLCQWQGIITVDFRLKIEDKHR